MEAFNKFNPFVEAVMEGKHDFENDALQVALTTAAATPDASDGILTDLTEISYANLDSQVITTTSSVQTGGTYKLTLTDKTLTASGTVATFRNVVIFNQDAAADDLIGWYDYGSGVTLNNGDTFQIDFDDANGVLQLA